MQMIHIRMFTCHSSRKRTARNIPVCDYSFVSLPFLLSRPLFVFFVFIHMLLSCMRTISWRSLFHTRMTIAIQPHFDMLNNNYKVNRPNEFLLTDRHQRWVFPTWINIWLSISTCSYAMCKHNGLRKLF
jgi:hypothetical protein